LREVWAAEVKKQADNSTDEKFQARVNVLIGLGRMTLDVIGLAGILFHFIIFGYGC
jgi:hypothetical protein